MASKEKLVKVPSERTSAAARVRLPAIGFWSYARQDDELSQGRLSRLRSLLMYELQQQYGRDHIQLFQDVSTIALGAAWEQEIREALGKTTFFIPIITPNFIQSDWCCREVTAFREREAELCKLYPGLPDQSRIFPIQYIDIEDVDPADPEALKILQSLQWFDFSSFRLRNYEDPDVREAIANLATSMRELLKIKVEDPAVARERARLAEEAAALALREEEAEAARVRELEIRQRREAAQAAAEAALKRAAETAEIARERAEEAAEAARLQAEEASEAARLLAEEEKAAEQARLEAEAAAQRLTPESLARAERIRSESEAAVDRARIESETAEQARIEKEAAAERARQESDALAARERALAEEAAAAAELDEGPDADGGARKRRWAMIAIAAGVLIAALIYISRGSEPAPRAEAWVYGRWGLDGDCSVPMTISGQPNQLRIESPGDTHVETIVSATPQLVVTDRSRFEAAGEAVNATEYSGTGTIPYGLTRCGR